ncbi:kinesin-related protein 11 [Tripterygium wilfordii]|uniref:Kinesin-like protein n=1 Tax=Tripterygium wilfordii TaxID=458696 RepID=A0A7J7D150_TRIWF|nr:kinesin-like protein KIN-7N [Tripterygium wilfordii]KAF5740077.1 kinesin-related protein 11 [Tripterygium wilfordii]
MEKICVAVRVRPQVSEETFNGTYWKVEDNRISLHRPHGTPISGISFTFDHVFDESSTNSSVYELLTKDIIHAAVDGFNGTAFAYGQTSSGKTYTMNGSESDPGIIHRAVKDVFSKTQMTSDREFLIRVSYMEIYNEEINDLFAVENQKLPIHESLERGVFVSGLREEIVSDAEQVLKLIEAGEENRHFGETNMNARSSRSHTIFRMVIESKEKDTNSCGDYSSADAIRVSVLNLVDLAGSERIAKTGAGGVRLKEGKHINKSLMILGNVINKLSDGAKNRGHIPYRDSKLTRILQPALGGNAKTSIICTVAPEEVHVEETKGTLQFASRAKRITNCAQVNEIMTDAALLKRQKLEIEELRRKLQGSHAGALEQEILKLRNEMLKYEADREKLEIQLEEERKSHKERVAFPDHGRSSSQNSRQSQKTESNESSQDDGFRTPCFKAAPSAFVVKRSNRSRLPDYSPLPETLSDVADEDTWSKMNNGFIADLDSLQTTPARKAQSFPSVEATPGCSGDNYEEVQNLKMQLKLVTEEKNELERKHTEQLLLNDQLTGEIAELKQELLSMQEIPHKLSESVESCKDIYERVLSQLQSVVLDGKSSNSKFIASMSEVGTSLFSTLENHFSGMMNSCKVDDGNDSLIKEQSKVLLERLKDMVTSLELSGTLDSQNNQAKDPLHSCDHKDCILGGQNTCWKEKLSNDLNGIKEKYYGLETELDHSNQLLKVSRERYTSLERELHLLKEERDKLRETVSESSCKLAMVTDHKENILRDLNDEIHRRKDLEEDIKQFNGAFASRQRSLMSFHSELRSEIERLRSLNPVSVSKSLEL